MKNNEELLRPVEELEKQEDWIGAVKCLEKAAEKESYFGKITFTLWVECWYVLVEASCLGIREPLNELEDIFHRLIEKAPKEYLWFKGYTCEISPWLYPEPDWDKTEQQSKELWKEAVAYDNNIIANYLLEDDKRKYGFLETLRKRIGRFFCRKRTDEKRNTEVIQYLDMIFAGESEGKRYFQEIFAMDEI